MDGYRHDVVMHRLPISGTKGYILNIPFLRYQIKKINPDIINVHYASGYGTLAMLSGLKDYIMSVWGSDVYDFPKSNKLNKFLVERNLNRAKVICSTSEVMAKHVSEYFSLRNGLNIEITPFGVDVNKFKPISKNNEDSFVIGTVKTLRPKYGIDILIKAFSALVEKGYSKVRLEIAGVGYQAEELKALTRSLNIEEKVSFLGWVENNDVPKLLNKFDLYVAPSCLDSESFGVAIVEASACALPVIVSNVGGLPEVVIDKITGAIVEPNDVGGLAGAIEDMILLPEEAKEMGRAGRDNVVSKYSWDSCVNKMLSVYSANIYSEKNK